MADRETIAATLAAGLLASAGKGIGPDAVSGAVDLYQRVLDELQKQFPTDRERNVEAMRRLGEQNP